MNRLTFWPASCGLLYFAAIGCGSGGSSGGGSYVPKKPPQLASALVPAGQEASYFPFAVGSQWTFDSQTTGGVNGRVQGSKKVEITYRLSQITPSPNGGQDAWFAVLNDGVLSNREVWRIDKTGIYQTAIGKTKVNPVVPPQLILPFPVKENGKFDWSGTIVADDGQAHLVTLKGQVVGQEQIDTEMGTFNALAVETSGTLSSTKDKSQIATKIWLIPGKGIGRLYMERIAQSTNPKMKGQVIQIKQLLKLKMASLKQ